jgi:L-ornithine N5-monooxygenase
LSCEDATVVKAEHSAPVSHTFTITVRHILGAAPDEERTYDAVIMGTGYERQSWLHMLDEESFGNVFGFSNGPSSSGLVTANHIDRRDPGTIDAEDPQQIYAPLSPPTTTAAASSRSRSPSMDDPAQTPNSRSSLNISPVGGTQPLEERLPSSSRSTTSLTSSHYPVGPEDETEMLSPVPSGAITRLQGLQISRAYRLLPRDPWGVNGTSQMPLKAFKPRVYIQGIAEETHGMSDTLLSVVSVRAGEVMDDLFRSEEARVREEARAM